MRNVTSTDTFSYSEFLMPDPPDDFNGQARFPVPLETSATYGDWGSGTLRSVAETWDNPRELATRTVTLPTGEAAETTWVYNAAEQVTAKDEYGGANQTGLLRQTLTNYAGFGTTNIVNRPSSTMTEDGSGCLWSLTNFSYDQTAVAAVSGVIQHDETNHGPGFNTRGNLTTESDWAGDPQSSCVRPSSPGGSMLNSTYTYDETGQRLTIAEPNGSATTVTFGYTDNYAGGQGSPPGQTNAFLTTKTYPTVCDPTCETPVEHWSWNYNLGKVAGHTDANGQVTSYQYNATLGRLSEIDFPDQGKTTLGYSDAPGSVWVETQRQLTSSRATASYVLFDGLGRRISSNHQNGSSSWDRLDITLDGAGLPEFRSYPCQATSGTGAAQCATGDTFTFDALGRTTNVTHADNSTVSTVYTGRTAEVEDEGNGNGQSGGRVIRDSQVDALGRLISVCEITALADAEGNQPAACGQDISGAKGFLTGYTYSPLDDRLGVTQGGETRGFVHDSLSRLLSSTNPESGTTSYVYDNDGNVLTQSRANGVVTSHVYDGLDRETSRSFTVNGSPDPADGVTFYYDADPNLLVTNGVLHMTRVIGAAVQLSFNQFDNMERPRELDTVIGGASYDTTVNYDEIGFPTYEALASGRKLYLDDDPAGRTSWIGDATYPGGGYSYYPYIVDRSYDAAGQADDTDLGNGLTAVRHFDSRDRLTEADVHVAGNYNWPAAIMDEGIAYNPDSTVSGLTDYDGSPAQDQSFAYDAENRLSGWSTGAGLSCGFALDEYGNLADASGNSQCGMLTDKSFNLKNQVAGFVYDGAGELLGDTSGTSYSWNGAGELSGFQVTGEPAMSYVYDGLGRRAEKIENGAVVATYIYNALGDLSSEIDGSAFTDFIHAPAGGGAPEERIAAVAGGGIGSIDYYHADGLGTTRAVTDGAGNNLSTCGQNASYPEGSFLDYTPFGSEIADCTQSVTPVKFTGKYRDRESGLDDFGARSYASNQGRFLTPDWSNDPEGVPYADYANPQSLNLYSYVLNNPATATDPDGHCCSDWIGRFVGGVFHAGFEPFLNIILHPVVTTEAIAETVAHPVLALKGGERGVVTVAQQISRGNPQAIGAAAGAVGLALIPGAGEVGDTAEAAEGADAVAEAGEAAVVDANKLHHIFSNADHGLDALVSVYDSQESAYAALQAATESVVQAQGLTGKFEIAVEVGGQSVPVRGAFMNGAVSIGTAFIPKP